jgi:FKBP-type peptidyl-prolyl cis-trans isomerase
MQGLKRSMFSTGFAVAAAALAGAALAAGDPGATAGSAPESRPQPASAAPALATEKDRISYAVGAQTGRALRTADGAEVDLEALVRGLKDGLEGARLQIPERQVSELLGKFQQTLRQKMAASRARAIAENRVKAERFLAENRGKDGVVTLASGLQYRILSTGSGPMPRESDVVTVNYRGTLLNGTEFDASPPGQPARLAVGALIAGWKEALKLMPVGSHWQLFIPPNLAYGERGVGGDIGPNEALVFDVELLDARLSKAD